MDAEQKKTKPTTQDSVAEWLLTLGIARARGDARREAQAIAHLKRLGVVVVIDAKSVGVAK